MSVKEHKQQVGNRIRALRLRKALTQQELADRAGISAVPIFMAEQKRQVPFPRNIRKIAEGLGVPVEVLTIGEGVRPPIDPILLGERVRNLRWRKGFSQEELALEAGISAGVVSMAESGRRPHPGTLRKLAAALEVGVEELTTE